MALSPSAYLSRPADETLSGGERKRVELAAVYTMQPKLAIPDDPDSGIDVLSLDDIGRLIRRMASEGTTVLLITHSDEMVPVTDVAALMCEGEIVRVGDPEEVRRHYARRCRPCPIADTVEEVGAYERWGMPLTPAAMWIASRSCAIRPWPAPSPWCGCGTIGRTSRTRRPSAR